MIRSVNEGIPLVIGRPASPAAAAIRRLAQAVIGVEQPAATTPAKQERRSLFGRR
jgi:MinD-like ATPase involved in chromosome partitioning or flagellar assembly